MLRRSSFNKKRKRLLSELINLKIGDLTDRILEEIIYDLESYGYKPLVGYDVELTGISELDNKAKYVSINSDIATGVVEGNEPESYDGVDVFYSHDIIADIMLNSHTSEAAILSEKVQNTIPKAMLSRIYNPRSYNKRLRMLRRKNTTRAYRKIVKIVISEPVDMSLVKDDAEEFINFK